MSFEDLMDAFNSGDEVSCYKTMKVRDFIEFNPKESLKKGELATKVTMDKLLPFEKFISSMEQAPFSGGSKFKNGDTLLARITPCLENGKTAFVDGLKDGEVAFGSTEFIVLRCREGVSDPQYIYYLATSSFFRNVAIKSMVGSSGRQRVQIGALEDIDIKVPSLEEQRKIASRLALLDSKIALNSRINDNLQKQAEAIYSRLYIDARNCNQVPLKDIANITMGQSPAGHSCSEKNEGTVFYQGRAEFGFRFPTRRLFTTEPKRMAKVGDILLSVRAPVGDINVAYEDCCIGRGLSAIESKTGEPSFLLYTLRYLRHQFEVFNAEGTVFGNINKEQLNNFQINLPPKGKIKEFESIGRECLKFCVCPKFIT